MAFENMDQAAQALAEAVSTPDSPAQSEFAAGAPTDAPNQLAAQPTTPQGVPGDQGAEQAPPVEEPFAPSKDIDLSGLNDAQRDFLLAREREMQSAFTRKTQELAQQRQEAEQAVQFITELNTNPYFAQEVVGALSQQLQAAGFTPAQADAEATRQVQAQASPQDLGFEDDEFDDDPYFREINSLREQQGQLTQYLQEQADAARVAQTEAQLNNMAAYIQSQNPDFTDQDMARVVNMSYAYNGDLVRASDEYKLIRQDAIQAWTDKKESVTAPQALPGGASGQAAPEKFTDINDPRLEAAALQRLNEALGS